MKLEDLPLSLILVAGLCPGHAYHDGADDHPGNRALLARRPFVELPLGSIKTGARAVLSRSLYNKADASIPCSGGNPGSAKKLSEEKIILLPQSRAARRLSQFSRREVPARSQIPRELLKIPENWTGQGTEVAEAKPPSRHSILPYCIFFNKLVRNPVFPVMQNPKPMNPSPKAAGRPLRKPSVTAKPSSRISPIN
jgi:hypothetical protein